MAKTPIAPHLPFLSSEPKVGDAPLPIDSFSQVQLRHFPGSSDFDFDAYLGVGVDGFVLKTKVDGYPPLVVKVASLSRLPFHHDRPAERLPGGRLYWAFERECINCALIEALEVRHRLAAELGQNIYLNPEPKTKDDAVANLHACFKTPADLDAVPEHLQAFKLDVQIPHCYGWTELKGSNILEGIQRKGLEVRAHIQRERSYYALVFAFVPKSKLRVDTILSQVEFFHMSGFLLVPFTMGNWAGDGVLIDFSDLVSPLADEIEWEEEDMLTSYEDNPRHYRLNVQKAAQNDELEEICVMTEEERSRKIREEQKRLEAKGIEIVHGPDA